LAFQFAEMQALGSMPQTKQEKIVGAPKRSNLERTTWSTPYENEPSVAKKVNHVPNLDDLGGN
jgi:hypothetical protein